MKTISRLILIVLVIPALFNLYSCENKGSGQDEKGIAEFSVTLPDADALKTGAKADSVVTYHILISIQDLKGNEVMTDSLIPIYSFGSAFVSENLKFNAGEYKLVKFMVINPAGVVLYAAPVAGSPLAYLTMKPLPFNFNIFPEKVTKVVPEVLVVADNTPDRFGYATFSAQVIRPVEFWTMCVLDPGNPEIMAPIQITSAKLTILAPDGWRCSFRLEPAVNHLKIRGGYEIYTFLLEKEGYMPQKIQITARQILSTSKENPLILKIPWGTQYRVITLQPGPDKGKDAMISNLEPEKNFGAHKYFEATFLSEPLLTVMRSNRSLISFNLDTVPKSAVIKKVILSLSYDLPIPFDSTYLVNTSAVGTVNWHGAVLQQVVEPWEEGKVTWTTQPKTIEANQVYIMPFIRNVNIIEVDVTKLFVPIAEIAAPNHGMMFKLWPTEKFPGFRFASSDYPEPKMRPRLSVWYTLQ